MECDFEGKFAFSIGQHNSYINVWDLQTEEKNIITPILRGNSNNENLLGLSFSGNSTKNKGNLLVYSNNQVQLYKIKHEVDAEKKILKVAAQITDEDKNIGSAILFGKAQILIGFNLAHGFIFNPIAYMTKDKKIIKEQTVNSTKYENQVKVSAKADSVFLKQN